jgi:hypothetical protein
MDGQLFVMDHTGVDLPGWPWSNGIGEPLTAAAAAQFIGTTAPAFAVAIVLMALPARCLPARSARSARWQ